MSQITVNLTELSLIKQLATKHKEKFNVESIPGQKLFLVLIATEFVERFNF